ncbi:hypothetical protein OG613_24520 [Streptomyces sp. NBC_00015]|uniref:hypothetical protein n=1 Tax=unclassified Streptomyces TaxID=2593676 RepID=UPI00224D073F|nr:hypothetical protein [Streptomyces sp. NBC_00103]MCX5369118.1 hypothetical protein [Streptomyces sp. NBC_00103]
MSRTPGTPRTPRTSRTPGSTRTPGTTRTPRITPQPATDGPDTPTTPAPAAPASTAQAPDAPAPTAPALPLLRRFLRQEKSDAWAVRLLPRIVFGVAALYTVITLASQSGSAFFAVVTALLLGLALWLLRRRTQLLLAIGVSILAIAFTGYFSAVGDAARTNEDAGATVTGAAAFGYWALAGMALLGAWMVKEHPGRRGITVVLADVILVIASVVGMFLPEAGVPLGFLGMLGVLAMRGSSAKAVAGRARQALDRLRRHKASDPSDS